jgi:hypothetical protein
MVSGTVIATTVVVVVVVEVVVLVVVVVVVVVTGASPMGLTVFWVGATFGARVSFPALVEQPLRPRTMATDVALVTRKKRFIGRLRR